MSPEVKGDDSPPRSGEASGTGFAPLKLLSTRRGKPIAILFAIIVLAIPALLIVAWWAPVPLFSLVGLVSWKSRYWLAGVLGGVVGIGFWLVEILALPQGAVSKLTQALAGAEGFSTTVMLLIGPALFGLVTALGSLSVAGLVRTIREFHV